MIEGRLRVVHPNSYGIVAPRQDIDRVKGLVATCEPDSLIVALHDHTARIGLLAKLCRFTLNDGAVGHFTATAIRQLSGLGAKRTHISFLNAQSSHMNEFRIGDTQVRFSVAEDRAMFLAKLAIDLYNAKISDMTEEVFESGLTMPSALHVTNLEGSAAVLRPEEGLQVVPSDQIRLDRVRLSKEYQGEKDPYGLGLYFGPIDDAYLPSLRSRVR